MSKDQKRLLEQDCGEDAEGSKNQRQLGHLETMVAISALEEQLEIERLVCGEINNASLHEQAPSYEP